MILHPVDSIDHRELEPYRTLRAHTWHWKEGFFVAEGERAVRGLLASGIEVISLLLSPEWLEALRAELARDALHATTVFVAPQDALRKIIGFKLHQNVMAIGRMPETASFETIVSRARGDALFVALEGISDAENMGMILRNCAAFGVTALLVGPDSCNPYLRRSVRVSLGAVFSLTVHRCAHIIKTLGVLRERHGWRIAGTTPRGGRTDLADLRHAGAPPLCLLFGGEAHGLSEKAVQICDLFFSIPMRSGVDSLNVANAVAVALYEATRHLVHH
jgi:tRNA G18 (ribose-2'-O)-methylase SpoU